MHGIAWAVIAVVVAGRLAAGAVGSGQEGSKSSPAPDPQARALAVLGRMVGGTWIGEARDSSGKPFVQLRFEWGPDRKAIHGSGTIAGTKIESRIAWDPAVRKPYYIDFHGPNRVYFGHYEVEGETLVLNFRTLVGTPGEYRANASWPDKDTYEATMAEVKDGKPGAEATHIRLHRHP